MKKQIQRVLILTPFIFLMMACSKDEEVKPLSDAVVIGSQTWTLTNLNVIKYSNGDDIPQVTDSASWANLTTGAWCYYKNNTDNGLVYGKLYNWYAVNDPRGLAPTGWHVANEVEWTTLITYLGEEVAGSKLKATTIWANNVATNSSGFTALPGGARDEAGESYWLDEMGTWWTSTQSSTTKAFDLTIYDNEPYTWDGDDNKGVGKAVRCVKD